MKFVMKSLVLISHIALALTVALPSLSAQQATTATAPPATQPTTAVNTDKQNFLDSIASDQHYVQCHFDTSLYSNPDLDCSFVPLTYDAARQIFGKGVADRFVVVEVIVFNRNDNYEYLLQDVRLGTETDGIVASIDKKLVRGLAIKTETFSSRAVSWRLADASSSLFSGIAGVIGDTILTSSASLFAGPGQGFLHTSIPDLSTQELTRIDDLGFGSGSTVVPKHSALPIVAFLSAETYADKSNYWKSFKKANEDDKEKIVRFQKSVRVMITGSHIAEQNLVPSIDAVISPTSISASTLGGGDVKVIVAGNSLDSITSVDLVDSTGKAVANESGLALISDLNLSKPAKSTVESVTIRKGSVPAGNYQIRYTFKDSTGQTQTKSVPTSISIQ